jgi:NAD-dependent oxidoreductase involved in siderophore biosynthesis
MDAILTGSTVREINCYGCNPDVQGAMRLVAKDGTVLWSDTVISNRLARSATSSFADNVAKKLVSHLASKPLPAVGE